MRFHLTPVLAVLVVLGGGPTPRADAQESRPAGVIFEAVRIFDGTSDRLSPPSNVLVVGNVIKTISSAPIAVPPGTSVIRIQGGGRTLMPGLIDAHTHIMFATLPQQVVLTSDAGFISVAATKAATDTARLCVREQLALGASQIKLMDGGGVASSYDPLDVPR